MTEHDSDDDSSIPARKRETNIPLLTSAFLAALTTGGTTYAFGLYGAALKRSLHLSQSQLDTISAATFCAGLLSWAPGMCVDRFGPRCSIATGGLLGAVCLILYWSVATTRVLVAHSLIVPALSTLGICVFVAAALVTGSVFKIIVGTCGAGTKGSAVGAAKGYVGLGAGVYACLFQAVRGPEGSDLDFLPMAAVFAVVAAAVPALLLLPSKEDMVRREDAATPRHFRSVYAGIVVLASFVVSTSIHELYESDSENTPPRRRSYGMLAAIVTVWFGPILLMLCLPKATHSALINEYNDERDEVMEEGHAIVTAAPAVDRTFPDESANGVEFSPRIDAKESHKGISSGGQDETEEGVELLTTHDADTAEHPSRCEKQYTLMQMLQTVPAWLLLWTFVILGGAGTIMTNNMGQMVEALDMPSMTASASLALFSVAQAGSRVATGAISEAALSWEIGYGFRGVPRPAFLICASLASFASHLLLSVAKNEILFVGAVTLSGAAFGMIWPLMVLTVGECFGTDHVGANYMFYDGAASAIGTLLLSKFLAQEIYEDNIHPNGGEDDDGLTCYGMACFRMSHVIVSFLSLSCVVTSAATVYTTRHVYQTH